MGKKTLFQEAMAEFTVEKFWKVGILCFLIIASMGLIGIYMNWAVSEWYQKVAGMFTVLFQLSLAYLFFWLLKNNTKADQGVIDDFAKKLETDEDMIKLIDNMKVKTTKKEVKDNGKKTKN